VENTSTIRNATNMIISATNMDLRPKRSDNPPRPAAPTRIPSTLAALMMPWRLELRLNSFEIRGSATPVTKTMKPVKNLPTAASDQMSDCMPVIGAADKVPSAHMGSSSMWSCTDFAPDWPSDSSAVTSDIMRSSCTMNLHPDAPLGSIPF
jgi:hypothetical protein